MASMNMGTVVLLLFCSTFVLWFIALMTPGWAVFTSRFTNWFNIKTFPGYVNEYQMSIFYVRVCVEEHCTIHPYSPTLDIFFNAFIYEIEAEISMAIIASGISCIVLMLNLENPTSTKIGIVAFVFLFAEIMECIVVFKSIAPAQAFAKSGDISFKAPYSVIIAVIGIITGVSGWVVNIAQYNNMRNQISQSLTTATFFRQFTNQREYVASGS